MCRCIRSTTSTALLLCLISGGPLAFADEPSALDLFRQRITPILRSPEPSSCTECHLSGVDLADYIGSTQEETFSSLRSAGLIDINDPDNSKLLQLIQRTPDNPTPVGAAARKQEYDAFRAWIHAAVEDPSLAASATDSDQLGPAVPLSVIRHARRDRILRSFRETIWSEIGRCVSCHSPELNRNKIGRNGVTEEDVHAISWIVPRDPAATLAKLVETGNILLDDPEASPVLTKPVGLEEHGGGPKFAEGSRTDRNFRRFLTDYAAILNGTYRSPDELPDEPSEVAVPTGQFLRLTGLPEEFGDRLLQVDVHRWTDEGWSQERRATADNEINGAKHLWQAPVMAVAPRNSHRAQQLESDHLLPAGRWLIRIYIDRNGQTQQNRDYQLGESEFCGEVEITGEWKPGFRNVRIVNAPPIR